MMAQINTEYATEIAKAYLSQYQTDRSRELFGDMTDGIKVRSARYINLGYEEIMRVSLTYPAWDNYREGELSIPLEFWTPLQAHLEFEEYLEKQFPQLAAA